MFLCATGASMGCLLIGAPMQAAGRVPSYASGVEAGFVRKTVTYGS